MAYDTNQSPIGARAASFSHSSDRSAAGIARSFEHAGRDLPPGMAQTLADRIAAAGGWREAYATVARKAPFSGWSDEDRWLAELIDAESDADHPDTALASLMHVLPLPESPVHRGSRERAFARASRLLARIQGVTPDEARAQLDAWVSRRNGKVAA